MGRFSEGPRLARTHAQCEELDTFFPVPAQYDNLPVSHDLYRGCGKYVLVRCLTSSGATQCAVVEVTDVE